MTDEERKALVDVIGRIIDHPSIYLGGPSLHARRKAEAILPEIEKLREADGKRIAALARRVEQIKSMYDTVSKQLAKARAEVRERND